MAITQTQIERARGQNVVWQHKLATDWPSQTDLQSAGITASIDTDDFIKQVFVYQESCGLDADGVIGPKTLASFRNQVWVPPTGSDWLWVDGKRLSIADTSIVTPDEPGGLDFKETDEGAWLRTGPVSLFVLHVKGAEGSALGTWSYLRSKGYGVHGSLERDGRLWAYCDFVKLATAHAGMVNGVSIGIEMTNQMYPLEPNPYKRPLVSGPFAVRNPASKQYGTSFERKVQGLTVAQLDQLVKIVPAVCDAVGIPKVIPGKDGKLWGGLLPELAPTSKAKWKKLTGRVLFSGVIGHFHVTNGHGDPSPDAFYALLDAGFKLQEIQI